MSHERWRAGWSVWMGMIFDQLDDVMNMEDRREGWGTASGTWKGEVGGGKWFGVEGE